MEALGALRAERKRKEKENIAVKILSPKKSQQHQLSDERRQQKIIENAIYLYPDPPTNVTAEPFAAGAYVYWKAPPLKENEKPVTDWEISRYRRNSYYSEWQFKGSDWVDVENNPELKFQCEFLTNGYEYCFSVGSRNKKGDSIHSLLSAPIFVDADLPNGWSRFFDEKKKKYYYYNLKTKQNSWTRPELDPYFVKHSVMVNFEQREITHLIALYDEEVEHFGCVYKCQFVHVLKEIGEKMSKSAIDKLFSKWGSTDDTIKSWPEFMETMNAIKNSHIFAMLAKMAADAAMSKKNIELAENEVSDEVRYFIDPILNEKILSTFDFQFLESLKNIFSILDINVEGKFTVEYLDLLLEALDIETDINTKSRLIIAMDQNNNDRFEFSEMCKMFCEIVYEKKTGVWKDLQDSNKNNPNCPLISGLIDDEELLANVKNLFMDHELEKKRKQEEDELKSKIESDMASISGTIITGMEVLDGSTVITAETGDDSEVKSEESDDISVDSDDSYADVSFDNLATAEKKKATKKTRQPKKKKKKKKKVIEEEESIPYNDDHLYDQDTVQTEIEIPVPWYMRCCGYTPQIQSQIEVKNGYKSKVGEHGSLCFCGCRA